MEQQQRRVTQKGQRARSALVEAALAVFSKSGYGSASVADIVDSAGLTKNHLFYHFGSKEALAAAALEQSQTIWRNELAMPAEVFPDSARRLGFCIRRLSEGSLQGQYRLLAAMRLDRSALPEELAAQVDAYEKELVEFWRRLLKGLKGEGSPAPKMKARAMATAITWQLCGAAIADDGKNGMFAAQAAFIGSLLGDGGGQLSS
ncbi:MAG: TetR/AcrR family transcriptional regulator [Planctomycetales bacterium]|nr:TetR/AcrR family transcriptional regulator [bacterium]UNM09225.1 MAG: TetR/AcrR family transcriptional regulator [Planctomycetales bacterium]